jgi:glycosyltransferase involved in cell wall biosynthesis
MTPGERRAMGAAGRADVTARFSWPSVIDRVEAAYEAALSR